MSPFFILCLPRSRSAWLANFLTYGPSFCFHEGLIGCSDTKALRRKMEATGSTVVGNSDCGNIFHIDEIMEEFPDARLVVVRRDVEESVKSVMAMGESFREVGIIRAADTILQKLPHLYSSLVIDFDDLNEDGCRTIWEYCTQTEFNRLRWEMLDPLIIQIDEVKKVAQLESCALENRMLETRGE